jgi:hypothetical protein
MIHVIMHPLGLMDRKDDVMFHLILHPLSLMDRMVDVFSIQILKTLFALTKILLMSTLMARCNGQLCYLFQMMHGIMSCFNSQFKVLVKCGGCASMKYWLY